MQSLLLLLLACGGSPTGSPDSPEVKAAPKSKRPRQPQAANHNRVDTGEAEPGEGLWNKAREPATVEEQIEALETLGYVGGDEPATASTGVTVHDAAAQDGLNFWVSGHGPEATLMDMDGKVLHTWKKAYTEAFPWGARYQNKHGAEFWRRGFLFPNGDVLAIFEGHGLVKVDKDSNILWTWDGRVHHDLQIMEDGTLWTLARKGDVIERVNPRQPVLEDFAVHLSADGKVLEEISLLEALEASASKSMLYSKKKRRGDIFHTNSIVVLGPEAEKVGKPAFAAGNLLVSMRTLSALMVVDPKQKKAVWWHQGGYDKQHDAKILDNGHLMLFDNLGAGGRSAVREYDVADMTQVWSYENSEAHPFFSRFTGAAYRLENGNTLVAESGYGRAFEVDPTGKTVWEFHNPNRAGDKGQFVAIIPDMQRIPKGWVEFL
ncbi:MAG: aryl-sulfate sulfotransferase [Alphaproteobacteria bacterium]|nr:aryl-sulfate sulfotransferase [Alphaproteobacteria bacterium]